MSVSPIARGILGGCFIFFVFIVLMARFGAWARRCVHPNTYARARRRAQWKNISWRDFKFLFVKFNFTEGSEFFNSIFQSGNIK
jgi:hypothetical protein